MFLFQPKKLTKYFSSGTGEIVGIFSLFFSQNLSGAGGVMTVYHQTGCDIGNMWGRTVDRRNPAKVDTEKHLFLLGFAYLNGAGFPPSCGWGCFGTRWRLFG